MLKDKISKIRTQIYDNNGSIESYVKLTLIDKPKNHEGFYSENAYRIDLKHGGKNPSIGSWVNEKGIAFFEDGYCTVQESINLGRSGKEDWYEFEILPSTEI